MKLRRFVMARRRGVVAVVAAALVATAAPPLGAVATSVPESGARCLVGAGLEPARPQRPGHAADAPEPGAGQTPPVSLLHLAMVHGAIYDAVNAIDGGYQPLPARPATGVAVGVGGCRRRHRSPRRARRAGHRPTVARGGGDAARWPVRGGVGGDPRRRRQDRRDRRRGRRRAAMLAARADDGRYVPFSHPVGDQPGEWRPAPPDEVSDPFAWVANVQPFTLDSPSQFRSAGPLALDSAEYTAEYNEVKDLGTADSARDPEQQAIAEFFTVNPVEMYNRAFRTVSEAEGLSVVDEARLFAMVNVTGADAVINCWDDKAYWHFWRPITAIHEGDNDNNDDTVGDPAWEPMLPTPPYPDSASGYNCVTASTMHAADAFFEGAPVAFSLVRIVPDAPEVTRDYATFTDVIADTIDARVFQASTSAPPTSRAPRSAPTSPSGSPPTTSNRRARRARRARAHHPEPPVPRHV